jgi:hypothetical protein
MRKKNGLKEIQRINRQSLPDAPVPASETAEVFSVNGEIKEKLKRSIYTLVEQERDATFAKLHQLPGFAGDRVMYADPDSKLLIWQNMSHEAIAAIGELADEGKVGIKPAFNNWFLFYMYDGSGGITGFPLATKMGMKRGYTKTHWVPSLLVILSHQASA